MDRLDYDSERVEELRDECRNNYPGYEKPCPGSALKVDDDVLWLDIFPIRILWGHDDPAYFNGYCPDMFGDTACNVDGHYINDRAPADPQETPMPVWPQQQRQGQEHKHDKKSALKRVLSQLDHEHQKKVRALVRDKAPYLLEGEHK